MKPMKENGRLLLSFDLDGTLIDSSQDLAISTNAMRAHFGLPPLDKELIASFVGQGAPVLVARAMGEDHPEDSLRDALAFFMQFYRSHSLEHTKLYPDVSDTLAFLYSEGHQLGVLTNKPKRISFDILDGLGVGSFFRFVHGGDSFEFKKPNPVGLLSMMESTGTSRHQTLMIGDSDVDVQTAANANVRSCGVTWGFQPESFTAFPPDYLISEPKLLLDIVKQTGLHE